MSEPIFSVVMPAHNAERYVGEAIESVLAQTLPSWELLIVDDCSTDRTLEICRSFKDPRIRVFSTPKNLNAAGARNLALAYAHGEFVAFLDSDDIALPHRLERQLQFFRENPKIALCGTHVETFRSSNEQLAGHIRHSECDADLKAELFFISPFVTSSVAMRRSILTGLSPIFEPEFAPCEDYRLWSRLVSSCVFANIPQPLVRYRLHDSQLTCQAHERMAANTLLVWRDLFASVGMEIDETGLELHHSLFLNQPIPRGDFGNLEAWLCQIYEMSRTRECLSPRSFAHLCALKWYCAVRSCKEIDLALFFKFKKSELSRFFHSRRNSLLLFLDAFKGSILKKTNPVLLSA